MPPIILGNLGSDLSKKTVCIYGHLDVQPASKADGWDTEPFEMTEIDGKLYGRGSTDDKGPVLAWLKVIEAFQTLGIKLPVNLKVCLIPYICYYFYMFLLVVKPLIEQFLLYDLRYINF